MNNDFKCKFKELTGFAPFTWQERLYHDYFVKGQIPSALDIPTGLGKTSVMVVWYLAFKTGANIPRRLIYVVDRRAVIDQATTVADEIRERATDSELCVSTLRGQHVDNKEWLADPATPSIIVGTVDMIGSKLLFSGYGVSRKMRPYHAGLLGADALVVLDEAHLVPPFEKLLETIADGNVTFKPSNKKDLEIVPSLRLVSLSATGRESKNDGKEVFQLLREDRDDVIVKTRLEAVKKLTVHELKDKPELVPKLAERARKLGNDLGPARVLVYCDHREDAVKVHDQLNTKKTTQPYVQLLIGGRRVYERENLSGWLKENGFLGYAETPLERPAFLIATSAGEVGVDLDADHMICDLVEWERMVQRFGRVNRRGKGNAFIEVIAAPLIKKPATTAKTEEWQEDWKERLDRLRKPLDSLRCVDGQDERDASPAAIMEIRKRAENCLGLQGAIEAAITPAPLRPALTRALVDAWSMTSLDKHTGRPDDVRPWLRGWEENRQPQTTILWRRYLPVREGETPATKKEIEAFFEAAPPHTSEKLETETYRVVKWFEKRIKIRRQDIVNDKNTAPELEDVIGYILSASMELRGTVYGRDFKNTGNELKKAKDNLQINLEEGILILDSRFGGLSKEGMLDENADEVQKVIDDEQDWLPLNGDIPVVRFRVCSITSGESPAADGDWRERYCFTTEQSDEGEAQRFLIVEKWRHDSETEDDRSVGRLQELAEHHSWTEKKARTLAQRLSLPGDYADMLATAARLHDEGKSHERWQRAAKVPADGKIYAKTNKRMNTTLLDGYRHEFGSLPYVEGDEGFKALASHIQELALHLVAAHHGWARPVISTSGCDEPPIVMERRACGVALRFARLQKQWGPWGLAWWEALLRAADQQASRENDAWENV